MRELKITHFNGKWYFNGEFYVDLSGIEKKFVDDMLREVKIDRLIIQRTPNPDLKRHNYQFN